MTPNFTGLMAPHWRGIMRTGMQGNQTTQEAMRTASIFTNRKEDGMITNAR